MSRQSLLDYLTGTSKTYDNLEGFGFTGGGVDVVYTDLPFCERPALSTGYDVFGVHWTRAIPTSHYTQGQKPVLSDITKWKEQVRFPVIDHFAWDIIAEQAKAFDRENKVVGCTFGLGPFERTSTLSSFEDCLVNAISEPEDYYDLIGAIADYKIQLINRVAEIVQPDFINLHDDWGTSKATFFDPELWRQTIKPHTQRMYNAIKAHGIIVGQHSCGHIEPLIGDIVEIGCQVWEAQGNVNNLPALNAQFGDKLCIIEQPPILDGTNGAPSPDEDPGEPDIAMLPLRYHPYPEPPVYLYV